MHLEPHHVLIQRVQQVARRERDGADVAEVVHHHLQQLAFQRFRRRGFQMGEGEHGGSGLCGKGDIVRPRGRQGRA